jgi:hypothetical protein
MAERYEYKVVEVRESLVETARELLDQCP